MSSEAAFVANIVANPDDDLPRLVFADWLEENGQYERANYIRLAIQFDPHRDRFDDDSINEQRRTLDKHEEHERVTWDLSFLPEQLAQAHLRRGWHGIVVEFRRGFVDVIELPVQCWVEYGQRFRNFFPTLRKLVLFRLNGWGERLAACESLRGIRELELACWYGDADVTALAKCDHLGDVERLVLWSGGTREQSLTIACGSALSILKEIHLVSREGAQEDWVVAVNELAGHLIATVYDFGSELFHFAHDFGDDDFFVGKLKDGSQLFALGLADSPAAVGWLFHPNGQIREPFRFEFPPALVWSTNLFNSLGEKLTIDEVTQRRRSYLNASIGLTPAFIRVHAFALEACDLRGVDRMRQGVEERWGAVDDPNIFPEADVEHDGGYGAYVYRSVTQGEYSFDFGNDWWCDRTGQVTST